MDDEAPKPDERTAGSKFSEAAGQAILLGAIAWALFALIQAPWYIPRFNLHPFGGKWLAVTFVAGAVPPLLVLLLGFVASWLVGAVRRRPDAWRSYRDGLIVAGLFTVLINLGIWFGHPR